MLQLELDEMVKDVDDVVHAYMTAVVRAAAVDAHPEIVPDEPGKTASGVPAVMPCEADVVNDV